MAGWLRKPRRHDRNDELDARRDQVDSLLPASAKHPEANRFTPLGSDFGSDEESDEDIEFLESIVRAVEGDGDAPMARTAPPVRMALRTPAPARRIPVPPEDELAPFREIQIDRERVDPRARLGIEDVDMADLIEELSTTAAALRRRKAA